MNETLVTTTNINNPFVSGINARQTDTSDDDDQVPMEESFFILIPLGVFMGIMLLSSLVYLMARNRRRLAYVYCKRRDAEYFDYHSDNLESPLKQGSGLDDDVDDDDNPTESLLKGRLQINDRYESYQTGTLGRLQELYT